MCGKWLGARRTEVHHSQAHAHTQTHRMYNIHILIAEELYVLETIERIYNESKALPERKAFTPRQAQYILSPPYMERAKQATTRPLVSNLIRDIDCEVGSQTERAITAQGYRLDRHIKSGGIGHIRKGYHIPSCAPVAAKVYSYYCFGTL